MQRVRVRAARFVAGEAGIGGERRQLQRRDEAPEEGVVAGCHHEVSVGGRIRLERRDRRVAGTERTRDLTGRRESRDRVLEDRDLTVEHRDIYECRLARAVAVVQRAGDAERAEEARRDVPDRRADARGRPAGLAGDRHDAAHRLHDEVVGGTRRQRSRLSEARDGCVDEPRKACVQGVPAVAEPLHRTRAEVLDEHVGPREQALEERAIGRHLQVERKALLAAVQRQEVRRTVLDEGADVARVVAHLGSLDLHTRAPRSASSIVQ